MRLREAESGDLDALVSALLEAVNWTGEQRFTRGDVLADPHLWRYVEGWPRAGDFGSVAIDNDVVVGAGWCRLFDPGDPGYGFVAPDVPELSIGVQPAYRSQGVGTALVRGLLVQARARGVHAVSLSVEDGNRARGLYERSGFTSVARIGNSDVMLLELPHGGDEQQDRAAGD
jgi:ribosomal protein S18 acetylase RimI-like enzyme